MKRTSLNVAVAFLTKLMVILAGIILQRYILKSFGSEINGLTSSVNQFISYFTLLEAGLGTASIQALYAPLANKDKDEIDGIVSATQIQYRQIGIAFFTLVVLLSFGMPLITNSTLNGKIVILITLLMGIGSVINYLFIGKYTVLLNADRRVYIIHNLDAVLGIGFSIIRILLINMNYGIITIQAIALLSPIIRMIFLRIYVQKKYKEVSFKAKPNFQATKKRWSVLIHQIVGMVNNHTDITLLTIFSTLSQVSVYSVYNYIYSNISALLMQTFQIAPAASFGKLYHAGNDQRFREAYDIFEWGFTVILLAILSTALVMTIPFVRLYTASVTDVAYIDPVLAFEFVGSTFFYLVRTPHIILNSITGTFKETQKGAIIEACINISISIPMFFLIGIRGLLCGTIIALAYRSADLLIFTYRDILHKQIRKYVLLVLLNILGASIAVLMFTYWTPFVANQWGVWIYSAGIVFVVSTCIILFCNIPYLFMHKNILGSIKVLIKSV